MDQQVKSLIEDILNKYLSYINLDILKDVIFNVISEEYQKGLENAEINFNQNFIPDYKTMSFVQNFAFDNVKKLGDDIKDNLRKEMATGLMNHESIDLLKERIAKVMDISIERAKTITVTETNRAFNMGHNMAAKDSGLRLVKQWNSQPERISRAGNFVPCEFCESLNGQEVEMDQQFTDKKGDKFYLPPHHPNCACRVIYVQRE